MKTKIYVFVVSCFDYYRVEHVCTNASEMYNLVRGYKFSRGMEYQMQIWEDGNCDSFWMTESDKESCIARLS